MKKKIKIIDRSRYRDIAITSCDVISCDPHAHLNACMRSLLDCLLAFVVYLCIVLYCIVLYIHSPSYHHHLHHHHHHVYSSMGVGIDLYHVMDSCVRVRVNIIACPSYAAQEHHLHRRTCTSYTTYASHSSYTTQFNRCAWCSSVCIRTHEGVRAPAHWIPTLLVAHFTLPYTN